MSLAEARLHPVQIGLEQKEGSKTYYFLSQNDPVWPISGGRGFLDNDVQVIPIMEQHKGRRLKLFDLGGKVSVHYYNNHWEVGPLVRTFAKLAKKRTVNIKREG